MSVCIACPKCGKDIPSRDLSRFVRFYHGDIGHERCPHCGVGLWWRMAFRVEAVPAPAGASGSAKFAAGSVE